jgi:hypothetical protein
VSDRRIPLPPPHPDDSWWWNSLSGSLLYCAAGDPNHHAILLKSGKVEEAAYSFRSKVRVMAGGYPHVERLNPDSPHIPDSHREHHMVWVEVGGE